MNGPVKTLLGSIGENNRCIKALLLEKTRKVEEVRSAIDKKARNKTPLDERQVRNFHEFTGIHTQEGGILRQSLMSIDSTLKGSIDKYIEVHSEYTEAALKALDVLYRNQKIAIHSLRRMIATSESTLQVLAA